MQELLLSKAGIVTNEYWYGHDRYYRRHRLEHLGLEVARLLLNEVNECFLIDLVYSCFFIWFYVASFSQFRFLAKKSFINIAH